MSDTPKRTPIQFEENPKVKLESQVSPARVLNVQHQAFLEAAQAEAKAEQEARDELDREPLAWQIKDGRAVGPLRIEKVGKADLIARPAGNFPLDCGEMSEKDSASHVSIYDPSTLATADGTITRIGRNEIRLKVRPTNWMPEDGRIYFLRKTIGTFALPYVTRLQKTPDLNWPLLLPPAELPCPIPEEWASRGENFLECLHAALTFRGIGAIKGPPGTGKTNLLAHAAALLAEAGYSVVTAALSHAAINNTLNRTFEVCQELPQKLVPAKRGKDGGTPLNGVAVVSPHLIQGEDTFLNHPIVGMTLASLIQGGNMKKADLLFLEEAGQIPAFQAAALSVGAHNVVLFGDEQQLEPILLAKHRNVLQSAVSAMEFIRRRHPDRMKTLTDNHRSNAPTVNFTRRHHYPTVKLAAATNAKSQLAAPVEIEIAGKTLTLPTSGVVGIPIYHQNRDKSSPEEAAVCNLLVDALLGSTIVTPDGERELGPGDFAVLSPNKRQAQLVLRHFDRNPRLAENPPVCGTVHKLQGQGIPIVIFSVTTSHRGYMEKTAEFLFNPSLWNVATSRASTLCIVLGNPDVINSCRPKTLKGLEMKQRAVQQLADVNE